MPNSLLAARSGESNWVREDQDPQIVVIDDDSALRDSLACALSMAGYRTASFASAGEFWNTAFGNSLQVVLVDLVMPGVTGLMVCRRLAATANSTVSFAVISGHADVPAAVEAMKLGAIDVLEKPFPLQRLLDVVARGIGRSAELREKLHERQHVLTLVSRLTPREREILAAMSDGKITKEIARLFGISARTVDVHGSRIMEKLELQSPSQLGYLISILEDESSLLAS